MPQYIAELNTWFLSNTIQPSKIKRFSSVYCASAGNSTYQWYNQEVPECTSSAWAGLSPAPVLWDIAWPGTAEQVWVSRALSPCSAARPQAASGEVAEGRQGRLDHYTSLILLPCSSWVWTILLLVLHLWVLVLDKIPLLYSAGVLRGVGRLGEDSWPYPCTQCLSSCQCAKQSDTVLRWNWSIPENSAVC